MFSKDAVYHWLRPPSEAQRLHHSQRYWAAPDPGRVVTFRGITPEMTQYFTVNDDNLPRSIDRKTAMADIWIRR